MKSVLRITITIFFSCFTFVCLTQAQIVSDSIQASEDREIQNYQEITDFFESDEILKLVLAADLKTLKWDIGDNPGYHPATISYMSPDNIPISIEVKVKTRGNFRKKRLNCNFPPLKLNLPKKNSINTIFAGQDKLKMVIHCQDKRKIYEQYLLQEYLIYKIYNLFTEMSFRVRLALITYVDTKGKYKPITKYAFFIEDEDTMAVRNGCRITKIKNLPQTKTNQQKMTLFYVFQYFIGNTDWSVSALHNVKLIQLDNFYGPPIAVPYDFDFSGVINPHYALPDPILPISSITERLFRSCRTSKELASIFAHFIEYKDEIYALYKNLSPLEEKYINKALKYYDKFYEIINNPKAVKKKFSIYCK